MNLRVRLLAFFLVAAFVPFGAFGLLVRTSLLQDLEEEHATRLAYRVASAQSRIDRRLEADRRAVAAICNHDVAVERTLLQLATDRFGPAQERLLASRLPALMAGRDFDTLHLLQVSGDRGRVLAAGHYPAQAGANKAPLLDALTRAGENAFVAQVRVPTDEGNQDARAWLTGCVRQRDGVAVAVVAGRLLGDDFVEALMGDMAPVHFAMTRDGEADDLPGSGTPMVVHRFEDGTEGAWTLVANIDDAPLQAKVVALKERSLLIAGAAFLLALLMAIALTLTLTRPLRQLEQAANRVAEGDLQSTVPVRRSDEVGSALTAFNTMTKELAATREKLLRAERIAAWREVARRIAHEIKNPLQPIQMEIETMRKLHERKHASFDEEFDSSTSVILEEVKRLNSMVTEFSKFARLPRPRPQRANLSEVVQHVAELHESSAVSLSVEAPTIVLSFDREQLTQVLMNLVQNAIDAAVARHGDQGGQVHVTVTTAEGGAQLSVQDNGPGIGPEARLRVFEPYFTTKAKGTGLGLAIVHRIVGDHGGTIDIEDGIDGGTAFVVFLPEGGPPAAIAASISDGSLPLGRAD